MVLNFVNMVDPYNITATQTPLGLLSLHSILQENNIESEICDLNYLYYRGEIRVSKSFKQNLMIISNIIMKSNPQIVSIYSMCNTYAMALIIARILKTEYPTIYVILAGPHATLVAKETLENYHYVDYIGMGEGELNIVENIRSILNNDINKLKGMAFRDSNNNFQMKWNKTDVININELPIVDVCKYNNINDFDNVLSIEGGRGCPFKCSFCSTQMFWGNKFRVKSVKRLIEEIQYYYQKYKIIDFSIQHDLFTAKKDYMYDFCSSLLKLNIDNINWGCSSRIDTIDKETLNFMSEAGCSNIFFGIESGSQKIQNAINKNLNLSKIMDIVHRMIDLKVNGTFSSIYGFPQETSEDLNKTMQLIYKIKQENLINEEVEFSINITLINFLPGTKLSEDYYHQLQYNQMDGMTFYQENQVDDMIQNLTMENKQIFLHCYNLQKNNSKKVKYFGYFYMIIFNICFVYYNKTLKYIFEKYSNDFVLLYEEFYKIEESAIIKLCEQIYSKNTEHRYTLIKLGKIFKKILKNDYGGKSILKTDFSNI